MILMEYLPELIIFVSIVLLFCIFYIFINTIEMIGKFKNDK